MRRRHDAPRLLGQGNRPGSLARAGPGGQEHPDCERGSQDQIEDELGDLLFVLVNLARFVKVDPEQALRRTNAKFRQRFAHVERRLAAQGREVPGTPIDELEALWQEAKR